MTTSPYQILKKMVILSLFFLSSTSSAYAAFIGFFDGVTLTINQTIDHGNITIRNAPGVFRVIDGVDTYVFVASTNVIVDLLDKR